MVDAWAVRTRGSFSIIAGHRGWLMHLQIGLGARQEQRLALLPQMLQSIEILQLSTQDLLTRVEKELSENETLELADPDPEAKVEAPTVEVGETEAAGEEEHWYEDEAPKPRGTVEEFDPLTQVPAAQSLSLQDHLLEQASLLELDDSTQTLLGFLIGSLDENGHLLLSIEDLIEMFGDEDLIRDVLDLLRSQEPCGVGWPGPLESMLAQIDPKDPDADLLEALVSKHLEDLAKNRMPKVAKALGLSLPELAEVLQKMKDVDPCPGRRFAPDEAELMRPDVVVKREDADWQIYVDATRVPPLQIRSDYQAMAKDRDSSKELKVYLRAKLGSARDLMASIEQRRETLGRVARAIFDRQREFLERGRAGLRPLKMQEVADAVGVHLSTVSRAISHKYVQTDWGIFDLRLLFDGGVELSGKSRGSIKESVRQLIEGEDKSDPLSDEAVVEKLAEIDLKVARRTVAKYRKELGLPSSWRRRQY